MSVMRHRCEKKMDKNWQKSLENKLKNAHKNINGNDNAKSYRYERERSPKWSEIMDIKDQGEGYHRRD